MRGDQQLVRRCFLISTQNNKPDDSLLVDKLDQRENHERGEPAEQLVFIPLRKEDPEKMVRIGSQLSNSEWQQLIKLLRANADIFTWSATDMSGIPSEIITYRLNINPNVKPVRQKK